MLFRWIARRRWARRRRIFRYHDGTRQQAIDPVVAAVSLHEHPEFLFRHLGEAADGSADAQRIVASAACSIFGVSPLSDDGKSGLTIAECLELMMAFDLYLKTLKKKPAPSPTRPSFTESTSPDFSEPTTKSTSGSGLTGSDQPSERPTSTASA